MARQITLELLADSSKFESGMSAAARAADSGAEKIEGAAKKADRMGNALNSAGSAADASESKFIGVADVASGMGDLFGIEALGPIAATGLALGDLSGGFAQIQPLMTGAIDKIKNLSIVTKAQSAAQAALNLVMSLNPIFLVVAAIAALIAILVVAYVKCETFRDIVNAAFGAVKDVVVGVYNWFRDTWGNLLGILTGPFNTAKGIISGVWDGIKIGFTTVKEWIGTKVDEVVGFFTGMPERITTAAKGMWNGIKEAFKGMINWIIRAWNSLEFTIGGQEIFGKKLPSVTFGTPHIDEFKAKGGPVWAGGSFMVGELGPELFVPKTAGTIVPNGAGGKVVNIHVQVLDATSAATAVVRAIEEYEARNGTKFARAS